MRIRFDEKTAVVSGAGHGFGRCIAETFAQRGARVFGCDLSAVELTETAKAGGGRPDVNSVDRPGSCRTMQPPEPWPRRPLRGALNGPLSRDQPRRDDFGAEGSA